jgi:hypothetical protein
MSTDILFDMVWFVLAACVINLNHAVVLLMLFHVVSIISAIMQAGETR